MKESTLGDVTVSVDLPAGGFAALGGGARSLIELVVHRLRHDIVQGVLQAGSRLLIDDLQRRFDVSGGTVREALSLLVSDGLVRAKAQRGFFVAPMSLEDLEGLARTRIALEVEAVRESVKNGGAEWEGNLVEAYRDLTRFDELAMRDPKEAFDQWEVANRNFHSALIAAGSSDWTHRFLAVLNLHLHRYRRLTSDYALPGRNIHTEHELIFERALARDAEQCALRMRQHIESSIHVVKKFALLR
ncbi:GntR family transcriptional regulator [Cupriavidus pauculus]|uniref:GntR family transcriptional regulator n=1 Tax=Cupriavidus pauculus TaxID=82633 RepID=UPI000A0194E6|nr:GntR family transcriptional regulator [Cupriavidus pauculus]